MPFRLLFIILGMTGFFADARADVLTLRQDLVVPGGEDRVEVTTFLAENEADLLEVVDRLRRTFSEDLAKNPGLQAGFEVVLNPKGRSPNAVGSGAETEIAKIAGGRKVARRLLPTKIRNALRVRYPDGFVRRSRMIFSVSRGVVNSTVATWSLMVTEHLPFQIAVAAGILTGGISGGLQYVNADIQKFLTRSLAAKFARGRTLRQGVGFVESYFRWYVLEVGFVAVVEVALTAMGHPPSGTVSHEIGKTLVTALAAVAAQGTWDIAVSRATQEGERLAKTALARRAVRFRSDFITLGLSALAVTGMIGKISGYSFGDTIFWGMGLTGGAYLVKVLYREWKCRRLLDRAKPPLKPDTLSAPPAGIDEDPTTAQRRDPETYPSSRFSAA